MQNIIVYTDGGSRGNPGPAGAGAVILDEKGTTIKEVSKYLGHRTNNFAEYEAVVLALESVKNHFGAVQAKKLFIDMRMDSELVCKQLNNEYQIKEPTLFPHFIKIHNMRVADFSHLTFTHIPRAQNARADKMANEAMDEAGN